MEDIEIEFQSQFFLNLSQTFDKSAEKIAIKFINKDNTIEEITYSGLKALSNHISNKLTFIPDKTTVGLLTTPNLWIYPIILALWQKKCSVAPMEKLNSKLIEICTINYVITLDKLFAENVMSLRSGKKVFHVVKMDNLVKFDVLCFALTTTGSTGDPVPVRVPWSCILPNTFDINDRICLKENDIIYSSAPLTFDPFFVAFLGGLAKGATLVFSDFSATLKNNFFLILNSLNVSVIETTPSLFKSEFSYERLLLGGEPFPENLPLKNRVFNIYGITELSCWAFLYEVKKPGRQPLGEALDGIEFKIVNGQLFLGSSSRFCLVGNETWGNQKKFRNSHDRVEVKNGQIFFKSRTDQIIKRYGRKIDLNKICKTAERLGAEKAISIFEKTDQKILLVAKSNDKSLKKRLLESLEILPDKIKILKTLPLNKHGKIDKTKLLNFLKPKKFINFKQVWCDVLNVKSLDPDKSFLHSGGTSVQAVRLVDELRKRRAQLPSNFVTTLLDPKSSYKDCESLWGELEMSEETKLSYLKENFQICWRFAMEKCVDSTVLIWDHYGDFRCVMGSHSGLIACLKIATGECLWSNKLPYRIETQARIDLKKEKIIIGCHDHFLYCLESQSGKIMWQFHTGDMIKSSPCLTCDNLCLFLGSYDQCIYRIKLEDGYLEKVIKLNEGSIRAGLVWDKYLFVATLKGFCAAFDRELNPIWTVRLNSPIFSTPTIISDMILWTEVSGNVHCMRKTNGEKLWKFECGSNVFSPIAHVITDNIRALLAVSCHDGTVIILEIDDDRLSEIKDKRCNVGSPIFASPCFITPQKILIFTTTGESYIINTTTLTVKTSWRCPGDVFSTPVTQNDYTIVGSRDNFLNCIIFNIKSHGSF